MSYDINSTSYPEELIEKLVNSYGPDSSFTRDAEIMASVASKDEIRWLLTVETPEYGTPEYEEYRKKADDIDQRFYAAGGDQGHSGFSWFTMLRICWMKLVNGDYEKV